MGAHALKTHQIEIPTQSANQEQLWLPLETAQDSCLFEPKADQVLLLVCLEDVALHPRHVV